MFVFDDDSISDINLPITDAMFTCNLKYRSIRLNGGKKIVMSEIQRQLFLHTSEYAKNTEKSVKILEYLIINVDDYFKDVHNV